MSRAKGNIAEDRATSFLQEEGYSILERNFYTKFGEIDIIAYKEEVFHFVEVKSGEDYEKAVQNMTPKKIGRILRSVDVFIKKKNITSDYCVDAMIVTPEEITLIDNITL